MKTQWIDVILDVQCYFGRIKQIRIHLLLTLLSYFLKSGNGNHVAVSSNHKPKRKWKVFKLKYFEYVIKMLEQKKQRRQSKQGNTETLHYRKLSTNLNLSFSASLETKNSLYLFFVPLLSSLDFIRKFRLFFFGFFGGKLQFDFTRGGSLLKKSSQAF